MPEKSRFGWASFAELGLALCAGWAFASASSDPGARLVPLLFVAAFFVPLRRLPAGPARRLERASWLAVGLTAVYGFAWSIYPVVPDAVVRVFPRLASLVLVLLLAVLLATRGSLASHRASLPCAIALMVIAAFNTGAALREPFAAAGAATFALLALDERGHGALGRLARLGLHALLAAGLAFGLARLLPWAQPLVEAYLARTLDASTGFGSTGFSLESNLGSVDELALSPRVLMNVETRQPTKLRAAVYVRFDGRRWELTPTTDIPVDCPPAGLDAELSAWLDQSPGATCGNAARLHAASSAELVRTRVVQLAPVSGALPTPAVAIALRRAGNVTLNNHQLAGPPGPSVETYAVLSVAGPAQPPASGTAPPEASPLQVPEDTALALRDLAASVAPDGATPEARVAATVALLQRDYHYSLKPGRFRSRQPVVEFLLEKKRGYCEYFASAAALLLRLQGVPTRYVRGFTVREANRLADRYVVREADAHAWIEALVPGRGWVEVDPTPADEYEAAHGSIRPGAFATLRVWLAGRVAELRAYLGAGDWRALARRLAAEGRRLAAWSLDEGRGVGGTLIVAVVLLLAWRRGLLRRVLRAAPPQLETDGDLPPELRQLVSRLEASWLRHGRPRPASRAWREHLRLVPSEALPPPLRAASEQVIDCFYRARYAGVVVAPEQIRAAREALERAGVS